MLIYNKFHLYEQVTQLRKIYMIMGLVITMKQCCFSVIEHWLSWPTMLSNGILYK